MGEGRQRALLALLLLHRNQPVSSDRLIDALWGEASPPTAAKVLQNNVRALRRALADPDGRPLPPQAPASALSVGGGEGAVARSERPVHAGADAPADARPADAATRLRDA